MKVAASDYDGTLFREDRIAKSDAEAIRKWREAGHKFGVVSGRDHGMLVPQLQHYGVGYDYLACNNGGIICTADGKVLWEAKIAPEMLAELTQLPRVRKSFHFARLPRIAPTSAMRRRAPGSSARRSSGISRSSTSRRAKSAICRKPSTSSPSASRIPRMPSPRATKSMRSSAMWSMPIRTVVPSTSRRRRSARNRPSTIRSS